MDRRQVASLALTTVFLDRDGVINEKAPEGKWIENWDQFRLLPSVPEAIHLLNGLGLRVIVVTNQRGIALNLFSEADVDAMHERLSQRLAEFGGRIDAFFMCPHDKGQCSCRKPLPGLFEQAQQEFPDIRPETSVMVGDSLSDIEFGRHLGMFTIFVEGDAETRKQGAEKATQLADVCCASLSEAADAIRAVRVLSAEGSARVAL